MTVSVWYHGVLANNMIENKLCTGYLKPFSLSLFFSKKSSLGDSEMWKTVYERNTDSSFQHFVAAKTGPGAQLK